MKDYTELEKEKKENNIAILDVKNKQNEDREFYHVNILTSLLKECTKVKLMNLRSIYRLHCQLYLSQFIGFSFAYFYPLVQIAEMRSSHSENILRVLSITFFGIFSLLIPWLYISLSKKSWGYSFWVLLVFCLGILISIEKVNYFTNLLVSITLCLTCLAIKKIVNMLARMEVSNYNLAKAIRTTSQYREHIASNFIAKTKLEIALKTAEDALENSRLYF